MNVAQFNPQVRSIATIVVGFILTCSSVYSNPTPVRLLAGESAYDRLGFAVSSIGDVNNDGFADVIIGALNNEEGGQNSGKVYIYSVKTNQILSTIIGERNEFFGYSVSGAGDIDHDGYDDYMIGAPFKTISSPRDGQVRVYSGKTGSVLFIFDGPAGMQFQFGTEVASAGDINGDGFDDIIVGTLWGQTRATVFSGADGSPIYSFNTATTVAPVIISVNGAGDVNQDGFPDLMVGEAGEQSLVSVYSGKDGSLLYLFEDTITLSNFGESVAGVGDVDKDGYDDMIIGAPDRYWITNGPGMAYVYSGRTGAILFTFSGSGLEESVGFSVATAGDYNGDGYLDFLVGAPQTVEMAPPSDFGHVYVYSGKDGALLQTFTSTTIGERFGSSVFVIDANNDGLDEVIVASDYGSFSGTSSGQISVFSHPGICCFTPGDANNDGLFNIADVSFGIARIFSGGEAPPCQDQADSNGDSAFNISDITFGIARIFSGGPGPSCGVTGM